MAISRRRFLKTIAAGGLAASQLPRLVGAQEAARRPNVLFIMTDQQPISTVGAYGNRLAKTPNMDRLAREGARFSNMHIAAFPCSPSRACYFTGMYAHAHGVVTNDVPLREDLPSLGNIFKAAGYQTAYIGKWHLGGNMCVTDEKARWSNRRVDDPDGFKFEKDGPWRGGEDEPQCGFTDKWVGGWQQFRQHLRDAGLGDLLEKTPRLGCHNMGTSSPEGTHMHALVPEEHHEVAFSCGEAEKFIRTERDPKKPFCMVVSAYGPHLPVAPPTPWDSLYAAKDVPLPENHQDDLIGKPYGQRRNIECRKTRAWKDEQFRDYIARYWGYCAYIDKQIGRVLKALDDTGLTEDTIVVFTTDHGNMVGAHGMIYKLGSCGYDELVRVPFLFRYPRAVKPGQTPDALVQTVDVLPTILSLCGIKVPETVQGRSFEDVLRGKVRDFRDVTYSDWGNAGLVACTEDWKYVSNWKQGDLDELYDMSARPLEVRNLAADPAHADKVKDMKSLLCAWLKESKNPYAVPVGKAVMNPTEGKAILEPRVASFRQGRTKDGKVSADFDIIWKVARSAPTDLKCWCFIQVVRPHQRLNPIITRATQWVPVPVADWKEGEEQDMGLMSVPIPADMPPGEYEVRTGLYAPDKKTGPPMLGGPHVPIGTLKVQKEKGGKTTVTFQAW